MDVNHRLIKIDKCQPLSFEKLKSEVLAVRCHCVKLCCQALYKHMEC